MFSLVAYLRCVRVRDVRVPVAIWWWMGLGEGVGLGLVEREGVVRAVAVPVVDEGAWWLRAGACGWATRFGPRCHRVRWPGARILWPEFVRLGASRMSGMSSPMII